MLSLIHILGEAGVAGGEDGFEEGLHTVIGEGAAPDELGAHVAGGEDDGAVERHFQAEGREAGVLHERRGAALGGERPRPCLLYTSRCV